MEKGIKLALKEYYEKKKNNPDTYHIAENELDNIGYLLMNNDNINAAIEIFALNVEEHPESWNVYDSLAEAYMKKGDKELAIKNYKKSLELDPDNTTAAEMLKELKKSE